MDKKYNWSLSEKILIDSLDSDDLGFLLTVIRDNTEDDRTREYCNILMKNL